VTAETAVTPDEELDELAKTPIGSVVIEGHQCEIRRIRTREVFTVMKILTAANQTGQIIASALDQDNDEDQLGQELLAGLIVAIPYAEDDFLLLLGRLVEPPMDKEAAVEVSMALQNPELSVTMDVIKAIIENESGELVRLGKEARLWWETVGPKVKSQMAEGRETDE
jgi:hypothetical protein